MAATGLKVGDYIFGNEIREILRGGMGVVYVMRNPENAKLFVYKTFQDEVFARSPRVAERFTEEATIWIKLEEHPNIVTAESVHHAGEKPYVAAEYVRGGDMGQWVGTALLTADAPRVIRFALQFCDGMTHALARGLRAHRDVKPQNCLIAEDGTLKITDFGLAKALDDASAEAAAGSEPGAGALGLGLTRTGVAAGTPYYMAPEQFDDAKHVDVRADIYSFGVMLHQMLAGRLPFTGRTWRELESQHRSLMPPPLVTPDGVLGGLVAKCLSKRPDARFADFAEVRAGLERAYRILTGEDAPQSAGAKEPSAFELLGKGVNLMNLGKYEEAVRCLELALERDPRQAFAWGIKGRLLRLLGRDEEALACFDRELEVHPRNFIALTDRGTMLLEARRVGEALTCFDRTVKIKKDHTEAWYGKGQALMLHGRYDEALPCLEYAERRSHPGAARAATLCRRRLPRPPSPDPHDARGEARTGVGLSPDELRSYEAHIAACDEAIRRNLHDAEAWYEKGLALGALRRNVEALACLDYALGINPRHARALTYKGISLLSLNKNDEALSSFDRALGIDSRLEDAWGFKGVILARLSRFKAAIACYERALEINPRGKWWTDKAHAILKRAYEEGWHIEKLSLEILPCLDRAIAVNPRDSLAWYNKGVHLTFASQRYEEALVCFEEALRLRHREAARMIKMCREKLHQQDSGQ